VDAGRCGELREQAILFDVTDEKNERAKERPGLCADCLHMRRIASDRGTVFYLCQKSASDPEFAKYPRLPVLQCRGYVRGEIAEI
jgi:hypothetical protein